MQMYSGNALVWVIPAILRLPLPYNGALKVFNISELRGVMIGMCPRFPAHYLPLLRSQKPQVLMADSFPRRPCQLLMRCSDSLGPTVHAHAQSICLCCDGRRSKALVKPDAPIKKKKKNLSLPQSESRDRRRVMERRGYAILMKRLQKGGCYVNGRIIGWEGWVSTAAQNPCIN